MPLFFVRDKFHSEILRGSTERRLQTKGGVSSFRRQYLENCYGDTAKVTII